MINLPLLSSSVTMKWLGGDEVLPVSNDWGSRYELICNLLLGVRGREPAETVGTVMGTGEGPRLIHVSELALNVSVGSSTAKRVPVNARLHEDALTVAGRPLQFGADAAKELLRHFSFGQRADLAADLTGMLMAIEDADFNLAADKFQRSHVPEFELPATFVRDLDNGGSVSSGGRLGETSETDEPTTGTGSMSGSYTKDRALAKQKALARQLKSSLKGEIVPSPEEDDTGEVETTNGDIDKSLGDEEYRVVAARYEREAGREPEFGDPHQSGWDIRSVEPKTKNVRLIEVKGRGRPWEDGEVVELSSAQIRKAFEAKESWYLYVVEKTGDGCYQVLPIANPVHVAAKWILCGESWRMAAEDAKPITGPRN